MIPPASHIAFWHAVRALPPDDLAACLSAANAYAMADERRGCPGQAPKPAPVPVLGGPVTPAVSLAPLPNGLPGGTAEHGRSPIGGATLDLGPLLAFTTQAYRQRFAPGDQLAVYLAGCAGLKRLVARIGTGAPVQGYKIGTCGADGHDDRMRSLSKDRYGSLWRNADRLVAEPGWDRWALVHLGTAAVEPSPGSPVTIGLRGLEVTLPQGLNRTRFDQLLSHALAGARLDALATSAAGKMMLTASGSDPRTFVRHSPRGTSSRRATELCLIKPRDDLPRLLRLVEHVIADAVLAT